MGIRLTSDPDQDPEMAEMLQSEPQLAAALSGGAFGCLKYLAGIWWWNARTK